MLLNNDESRMRFLLYTKINDKTVKHSLGLPEYSYYFVYKGFKSIFAAIGEIITVCSKEEIENNHKKSVLEGVDCLVVFFVHLMLLQMFIL